MAIETPEQHEALIRALMDWARWPQGGGDRRRIDTHISVSFSPATLPAKIKNLSIWAFSTSSACTLANRPVMKELRLNRRLAPDIYLDALPVTGSVDAPRVDGGGPVIDWAVVMRRFDPDAILANLAAELTPSLIARLAHCVATFHAGAAVSPDTAPYGGPEAALAPMQDNFDQITALTGDGHPSLNRLRAWTLERYADLLDTLCRRKATGHVRECHGDLHLGNVALIDGEPVFDAIEFNPGLRWIDTLNDVAFLTMDLHHGGRAALAYCFLDRYLQITADYEGLAVLRFYEVYRAMVRAKIAAIRQQQDLPAQERQLVEIELASYLTLAERLTAARRSALIITYGLSGSGKSFQGAALTGPRCRRCVCVRMSSASACWRGSGRGRYGAGWLSADLDPAHTRALPNSHAAWSMPVIIAVVDATFLLQPRSCAVQHARGGTRSAVRDPRCDARSVLRQRILMRRQEAGNVSDADLAVLERQLVVREPLWMRSWATPSRCDRKVIRRWCYCDSGWRGRWVDTTPVGGLPDVFRSPGEIIPHSRSVRDSRHRCDCLDHHGLPSQ